MRKTVDIHCHLTDEKYKGENIFSFNENLDFMMLASVNIEDAKKNIEIASKMDNTFVCVGIHPHDIHDVQDDYIERLLELSQNEKVVAIGEIGLDYHYEPYDEKKQKEIFIAQLELARRRNLPVVVHQRDCTMDAYNILKEYRDLKIVLHCFSESVEIAREYMKIGAYFSFGGTLTYKNNKKGVECVREIPLNRLFTETDSPYLPPDGHRGEINYPKHSLKVMDKIAEVKSVYYEDVFASVRKNVKEVFGK